MRFARYCWIPLALSLAACQQPPSVPPSPQVKIGKPYVVEGKSYVPAPDPTYDKIGEASWYGPGFHGKYTASGEVYDQNDLTAAHPTLPMPSLVRVTNLENGKSLIVRINDRGPFKSNRIIDLSKRAAERLGVTNTSHVRVQYLKQETEDYLASLQNGGKPVDMATYNEDAENAKHYAIVDAAEASSPPEGESIVSSSHAGQMVSDAAPVMTVSTTNLSDKGGKPVKTALVSNAWADDNVTLPSPDKKIARAEPDPAPAETKAADPAPEQDAAAESDTPIKTQEPPVSDAPKNDVPQAAPEESPAPAQAAVETPSAKGYFIQVGSFAAEENARKMGALLSGVPHVTIDKVQIGGKTWWRVRAGPFAGKGEATGALAKVRSSGAPDARITHQ